MHVEIAVPVPDVTEPVERIDSKGSTNKLCVSWHEQQALRLPG